MTKIVRTPTKAHGGITKAEREAMDVHSRLWIEHAFRTAPIEPDKIVPAIEGIYAAAGLKKPRVVIVPSPMVMAFAYGASAAIWHRKTSVQATAQATAQATYHATYQATRQATDQATRQATYQATRQATDQATAQATYQATRQATVQATDQATYHATDHATDQATAQATYQATRQATDQATAQATYQATRQATVQATDQATYHATDQATAQAENSAAKACFSLAGKLGLECAMRWGGVYAGGNMWAYWDCYLSAARDILKLDLPQHAAYAHWEQAAIHGGFRVMHQEFCMVSDFPEVLKVDDRNLPHCEDGPSHRWRDGWALYHWHGVRIPAEWIEERGKLTAKMALTWANVEQRRAACELVGWECILRELNAKTIDKDEDPMVGELVEVMIPDVGREKFLRVVCGTGRKFAMPVPPNMKTALQANAWTYNIEPDVLKLLEART